MLSSYSCRTAGKQDERNMTRSSKNTILEDLRLSNVQSLVVLCIIDIIDRSKSQAYNLQINFPTRKKDKNKTLDWKSSNSSRVALEVGQVDLSENIYGFEYFSSCIAFLSPRVRIRKPIDVKHIAVVLFNVRAQEFVFSPNNGNLSTRLERIRRHNNYLGNNQ